MKSKFFTYFILATTIQLCACEDDETFSTSPSDMLTFSTDTVRMDTVFSTVPSSTRYFWVYNKSGENLRCKNVRLENGNQIGFRVNVDGAYLGATSGYQVNDIEVRDKDSIRVFVELTSPNNYGNKPTEIEDNIIFSLESGRQQKVNLNAFSWDATMFRNMKIDKDTIISSSKPIVVYGGIDVAENATLTIGKGTTLYFHGNAGINVHGTLVCQGTANETVTLRGDRLDRMFDYLPYDNVSGQWNGIRLTCASYGNHLTHTDIHGTFDGLKVDSSDVSRLKLTIENSTIHNCQGTALDITNSFCVISNCQLTNTLGNCLNIEGGRVEMNNSTLAQFYPFDSNRGVALRFSGVKHPLQSFVCTNSLVTGYADDEMSGLRPDKAAGSSNDFNYTFSDCIMRTVKDTTEDSVRFVNVALENPKDTADAGTKHFVKIDSDNQSYDFHLAETSKAIGAANPVTATKEDHDSKKRDEKPDIGAYEFFISDDKKDQ